MRMRVRAVRFVFLREFFTKCETLHLEQASTRIQPQTILVFNTVPSFRWLDLQNRLDKRVGKFFEILLNKQELSFIYSLPRQRLMNVIHFFK